MSTTPWAVYDSFIDNKNNGSITVLSDSIKVALFTSAYSPDLAVDNAFSTLTGEVPDASGYSPGGESTTMSSNSDVNGKTTYFGTDVLWNASSGSITSRYAVAYSSTADRVVAYSLLDDTNADVVTTDGNTLTLDLSTYGLFDEART